MLTNVLEEEQKQIYQSKLNRNYLQNEFLVNLLDMVDEQLAASQKNILAVHKNELLPDFLKPEEMRDAIKGYDACLFCLGVSSVGMKPDEYKQKTYDLTLGFANVLHDENPNMSFSYISGAGTDSTEQGRLAWARVKGKTENDLAKLDFGDYYSFRPAMIQPTPGLKNALSFYKYINWLFPDRKSVV